MATVTCGSARRPGISERLSQCLPVGMRHCSTLKKLTMFMLLLSIPYKALGATSVPSGIANHRRTARSIGVRSTRETAPN
jgi:hypothetical protein